MYVPSVMSTAVSLGNSSSLNFLPIIGWSIFGLTLTIGSVSFAIYLFQKAEKNHFSYENVVDI